jgi:DNA polymerase-3 subunit delta
MELPVKIIVSEDSFLINREIDSLLAKYLDLSLKDFNYHRFLANSDSVGEMIEVAMQLPVSADYRVVLIKEAEKFKKDDLEKLKIYFGSPSPSTCFIIQASKIDKRLKVWQRASKAGWIQELKVPYENQMVSWVMGEAKRMGLEIDGIAANIIVDNLGVNLMGIILELEKLALYIYPDKKITADHLKEMGGSFLSKTVFSLVDALSEKNLSKSNYYLSQLITGGESMVKIVFMITRHFRLVMLAYNLLRKNIPANQMASQLGVHPFFVKDYLNQATKISPYKLKNIFQELLVVDRKLKSSSVDKVLILNNLFLKVCTA